LFDTIINHYLQANEQKLRYTAEIKLQHKKITILDRKLKRLASILETIEGIQPTTKVYIHQQSV
jgi:hypothetical protein